MSLAVLVPTVPDRYEWVAGVFGSMVRTCDGEMFCRVTTRNSGLDVTIKTSFPADKDRFHMVCSPENPTYAMGMNLLVKEAEGFDWLFLGSDDIRFHPEWYEKALAHAGPETQVIGTNDIGNPRTAHGHSTHSLIRGDYPEQGTLDGPPLFFEGYQHNFVDDELITVATQRGVYAHAPDSIVEHCHPFWGKRETDATDERNTESFEADRERYVHRRKSFAESVRQEAVGLR